MKSESSGVGVGEGDERPQLGWQAQCHGCDWASVLHLDMVYAIEDAEVHTGVWHHEATVASITEQSQIRNTE